MKFAFGGEASEGEVEVGVVPVLEGVPERVRDVMVFGAEDFVELVVLSDFFEVTDEV